MGSGQDGGAQRTVPQSTKLSVLKKSRENPHIQIVQNLIDKAYNYSDLTTLLKNTREKSFCKTPFHLRIDEAKKKDRNKAEMKERKMTTGHLQKISQ